jgi:hypothetical protein
MGVSFLFDFAAVVVDISLSSRFGDLSPISFREGCL